MEKDAVEAVLGNEEAKVLVVSFTAGDGTATESLATETAGRRALDPLAMA